MPTPNIPGNTRPTASITSPANGSTFPPSSSIRFTGSGLDSEDGQLSGNSLVWTSIITGQIGIGSPIDASLSVGDHVITLKAKDSAVAFDTASINVSVNSSTPFNSRPVASISAPAGNVTFLTSDSITFTGSAFDAQDGQLSGNALVWTSNIDGQIGTGESFSASLSAGNQIISLLATDNHGDIGTATVSITVNQAPTNEAPTASINIPDDVFVYLTTDSISFAGTGSDAEDGSLSGSSLVWTSDLEGTIGDGESISISLSAGIHLITFTATDSLGATGNESISITVNPPPGNDAPTASINTPDDVFNYLTTDTINFTGTGSDPEDGELTGLSLVWRSSLAGQIGTGTSISLSLGGGNHTITLTATDSLGATGSHSINLTVNLPPTASIGDPDDGFTFLTTETIHFNGSGLDAEDGVLTGASLVWSSNLAGQIGTGTSISVSLDAGAHTITLTATDSQGVSGTASINTNVDPAPVNNPPSASINIPDDVFTFLTTDTINFAGTGSDAEDGNLTGSSLVWSSNLAGQIGTGTSINVSLGAGIHTITLTATDSLGAAGSESINITVSTPPSNVARVSEGLVVLYDFEETSGNTVHDVSGVGSPLNLDIRNSNAVSRPNGALSIDSSTIVQSDDAAIKLIDALQFTNEITIEAWLKPANTTQNGPARIITLSKDTRKRNFTLGQERDAYDTRLRTTSTSDNGTPSLRTPNGSLTTDLTHVMYTRSHPSGETRTYINGDLVATGSAVSTFNRWDDDFRFALANEFTLNRAWLGELHLVAIYDRDLSPADVSQNFQAGPNGVTPPVPQPPPGGIRVNQGLVALYDFEETSGATVLDVSGVGTPLNLTVDDMDDVARRDGALFVKSSTVIKSHGAASKIIGALKETNEITIEAWIQPDNITQDGPARIVTLSSGTSSRNFTLGQEDSSYDTRLRTTSTNNNGIPSLRTPGGSLTARLDHVVFTRSHPSGETRTYINGNLAATGNTPSTFGNWSNSFRFALANELSNNRAWLGKFYLVAIYDRALTQADVSQNFAAGHNGITDVPTPPPQATDVTFQKGDGKGSVSETDDAELEANDPNDNAGNNRSLNVDGQGAHAHVVLKFPNIFGTGENQIPLGSTINSATLTLRMTNTTNQDPTVYRIIESWDESEVTWRERRDDVNWSDAGADGTGSHAAVAVGNFPMTRSGFQSLDVTASLQLWPDGHLNEGWVFIENSTNGADFHSSETRKKEERPKLTVDYTPP